MIAMMVVIVVLIRSIVPVVMFRTNVSMEMTVQHAAAQRKRGNRSIAATAAATMGAGEGLPALAQRDGNQNSARAMPSRTTRPRAQRDTDPAQAPRLAVLQVAIHGDQGHPGRSSRAYPE